MHKCDEDGDDGGDFSTTVLSTLIGKCWRKRTARLGLTGREKGGHSSTCSFHFSENSSQFDSSNWQVASASSVEETPQQGFGILYLACQFSLRHTKYNHFCAHLFDANKQTIVKTEYIS